MATMVLSAWSETKKGRPKAAPHSWLVTMKIFCAIASDASLALGVVIAHDQARAQAVGCVIMEVGGDREDIETTISLVS
jgi:hypothetical protein